MTAFEEKEDSGIHNNDFGRIVVLIVMFAIVIVAITLLIPNTAPKQPETLPTEVQKAYEVQGAYGDIQY